MASDNIEYFYVSTEFCSSGSRISSFNRNCQRPEHVITVENTGHFPADVVTVGETPSCVGCRFTGGEIFRWTKRIFDMRTYDPIRRVNCVINFERAYPGHEIFRSGILQYTDRNTGGTRYPQNPTPITDQIEIT